jgi:putative glutamine amidotransferase
MTRILLNTWRRQGRTSGPVVRDMIGVEAQFARPLQEAGAQVFLAPQPLPGTDPAEIVRGFDGLLLIGGEDLAAEVGGADPALVEAGANAGRDRWEIALLRAALADRLSVLGICRGMQSINAAFGGTLYGDIAGFSPQHPPVPVGRDASQAFRHKVWLESDSILARAYGTTVTEVNSLHHQAVDRLGTGLRVTARAEDGTVEAVEADAFPWCLGVQWHPELLLEDPVHARLIAGFAGAGRTELADVLCG